MIWEGVSERLERGSGCWMGWKQCVKDGFDINLMAWGEDEDF